MINFPRYLKYCISLLQVLDIKTIQDFLVKTTTLFHLLKQTMVNSNIRFAGATLWNSLDENLKKEKKKTLRANYLIPSLIAINRDNSIKHF